jgi:hypothetical protein
MQPGSAKSQVGGKAIQAANNALCGAKVSLQAIFFDPKPAARAE